MLYSIPSPAYSCMGLSHLSLSSFIMVIALNTFHVRALQVRIDLLIHHLLIWEKLVLGIGIVFLLPIFGSITSDPSEISILKLITVFMNVVSSEILIVLTKLVLTGNS